MGGIASAFSGKKQRQSAIATAQQQEQILTRQREEAMNDRASSLQNVLEDETNRLLRTFGSRTLASATARMTQ